MPFIIQRTSQCPASKPFGVFTETSHGSGVARGYPHGCFPTEDAARQQQKALYENVPEAKAELETGGGAHMSASSPVLTQQTDEWRRERAEALSATQRKRPESRQSHAPLELRDEGDDGKRMLRSYASLFNEPYTVRSAGHRFEEVVRPGAFKRTLGTSPDVVFRTEHSGPPLAATWSGDLRLGEDARGLWYEVDLDPTDPDVQSLISKVNRGVYRESSFAFRIPRDGDRWSDDHDQREVLACELDRGDVSVVTYGASRATAQHMVLRAEEEALQALQDMGFERFVQSFLEWRDHTILPVEERVGKVVSSSSMETLRKVLSLISDGSDAVDEGGAMLADFLNVPVPGGSATASPTSAEQLGHTGRSEETERNDPTMEDYGVMAALKEVNLGLAHAKAKQLADPDNSSDPDDKEVMQHIMAAQSEVEAAIVAQSKDGRPDDAKREEERIAPTSVGALDSAPTQCSTCNGSGKVGASASSAGTECSTCKGRGYTGGGGGSMAQGVGDQSKLPAGGPAGRETGNGPVGRESGPNYDPTEVTVANGEAASGDEPREAVPESPEVVPGPENGAESVEGAREEEEEPDYWLCSQDDVPDEYRVDLSAAGRAAMAKSGTAMPDGSFPIPNVAFLKRAIQAFGRAGDKPAVKAWIKKRASALGATNLIPDSWRSETPAVKLADNDSEDLRWALRMRTTP